MGFKNQYIFYFSFCVICSFCLSFDNYSSFDNNLFDNNPFELQIYATWNSSSPCSGSQCFSIDCPCPSIQDALNAISNSNNYTNIYIILLSGGSYIGLNNQNLSSNQTSNLYITTMNYTTVEIKLSLPFIDNLLSYTPVLHLSYLDFSPINSSIHTQIISYNTLDSFTMEHCNIHDFNMIDYILINTELARITVFNNIVMNNINCRLGIAGLGFTTYFSDIYLYNTSFAQNFVFANVNVETLSISNIYLSDVQMNTKNSLFNIEFANETNISNIYVTNSQYAYLITVSSAQYIMSNVTIERSSGSLVGLDNSNIILINNITYFDSFASQPIIETVLCMSSGSFIANDISFSALGIFNSTDPIALFSVDCTSIEIFDIFVDYSVIDYFLNAVGNTSNVYNIIISHSFVKHLLFISTFNFNISNVILDNISFTASNDSIVITNIHQQSLISITNFTLSDGYLNDMLGHDFRPPFFSLLHCRNVILKDIYISTFNNRILAARHCENIEMTNMNIENLYAIFSSILWIDSTPFSIYNSTFTEIQAFGPFGIIETTNSTGIVENLTFQRSGDKTTPSLTSLRFHKSIASVSNCTFQNCFAVRAGGIFAINSDVNVTDSLFDSCHALVDFGGGLFIENSTFILSNNNISNCYSIQDGGGLYAFNSSLSVNDNYFSSNNAVRYGGAIRIRGIIAVFNTGTNNFFTNNTGLQGGALYVGGNSSFSSSYSTFYKNIATSSGGAFSVGEYANLVLQYANITENSAASLGGAGYSLQYAYLFISNSTLKHNSAATSGGALYTQDSALTSLSDVLIANNSALNGGGLLFDSNELSILRKSIVINNFAKSTGGGITGRNNISLQIYDSHILANYALSGAGLWLDGYVFLTIADSYIKSNQALSRGGGILLGESCEGSITNTIFYENFGISTGGGGLYIQDQAHPSIDNCTFICNSGARGGAIATTSSIGATITNTIFSNNSCTYSGGAISIQYGHTSIYNSLCSENTSPQSGGCLTIGDNAFPILHNFSVNFNKAKRKGGGIYCMDNSSPTISNLLLFNNTAEFGGGIYSEFNIFGSINDSFIHGNRASSGGGMFSKGASTIITNVSFTDNEATSGGGFTYVLNTPLNMNFSEILFHNIYLENNKALLGGGIYLLPSNTLLTTTTEINLMKGLTAINNTAIYGGGISMETGVIPPQFHAPVILKNNTATKMGGGIFVNSLYNTSSTWLNGAKFENNTAIWAGSTIAWEILNTIYESYSYCNNCSYSPNLSIGYQDNNGMATYPWEILFVSPCPTSVTLDGLPITVSVFVNDQFGSIVTGAMVTDNNLSVILSSECIGGEIEGEIDKNTGYATFDNVILQGRNNITCPLIFEINTPVGIHVQKQSCSILLYGCKTGEKIESGDTEDYCKPRILSPTRLLWITIVSLVTIISVVLTVIVLCGLGKIRKKRKRMKELSPLFTERPNVTIENILRDPDIPKVNWNHLTIEKQIGIGAAGLVSKAILTENGEETPVALKELLVGLDLLNESVINEFLVEIKLMSAMKHPNIVKFIGICCPDAEKIYLVTELMELGSVKDLLISQPHLSWQDRISLMIDAAKGLKYLHDNKLIHRDIKPHNLLVNGDLACKIADFGISTVMPENTRTMTCVGTPVYMAPEVLSLDKYSAKADVYSFGILLMEIITDLRPYSIGPFARVSNPVLMHQIIENNVRPEHGPLPEPLQQLIDECIDGRSDTRPDFDEIITRLERLELLEIDIFDILMYSRKLEKENDDNQNNE